MESRAPQRTCIGCRRRNNQDLLLRVSRNPGGELALTLNRSRSGRGVYVCPMPECIDAALKGDRLARALRKTITAQEKETLRRELTEGIRTNTENAN